MFDFSPEEGDWNNEPTGDEVQLYIAYAQKCLITHYNLRTAANGSIMQPPPARTCRTPESMRYHLSCSLWYVAARRHLQLQLIPTLKHLLPQQYHAQCDALLTNWLPRPY